MGDKADIPRFPATVEERLPLRGLIASLIEDRQLLARPEVLTAEQKNLDDRALVVMRSLMDSEDERTQASGAKQWRLRLKELRAWREAEIKQAVAAIEALTAECLGRLQLEAEQSGATGPSPETVTAVVREVMQGLAEEVGDGDT